MNISCVIIEDLEVAAQYLKKCCEKSGELDVKGHFTNVNDAAVFLNDNMVDLLVPGVGRAGAPGSVARFKGVLQELPILPKSQERQQEQGER